MLSVSFHRWNKQGLIFTLFVKAMGRTERRSLSRLRYISGCSHQALQPAWAAVNEVVSVDGGVAAACLLTWLLHAGYIKGLQLSSKETPVYKG